MNDINVILSDRLIDIVNDIIFDDYYESCFVCGKACNNGICKYCATRELEELGAEDWAIFTLIENINTIVNSIKEKNREDNENE